MQQKGSFRRFHVRRKRDRPGRCDGSAQHGQSVIYNCLVMFDFRLFDCSSHCTGNAGREMGKPEHVAGNQHVSGVDQHGPERCRGGAVCWREK